MVLRCVYCHDDLGRRDRLFCATCLAPHHAGCRHTHGRCAAPGCDERQVVRPRLPRAPRPREDRPTPHVARSRSGALLTGMAGVAIGCVVVAAGVAAGELLASETSTSEFDPAPAVTVAATNDRERGPVEVLLTIDGWAHSTTLAPRERLVFLGGPWSGVEVKRVDVEGTATSLLVLSPTSGVELRVIGAPGSTWVPASACPVVLGFDGHTLIGGTRRPAPE